MAPKLILLFDKLGAAESVLELDRLSSTDRMMNLKSSRIYLKFTFTNLKVLLL